MSMTGTGTQADPYIVDTFDDFVAAVRTSNTYVSISNDINVAEEYPDGYGSTITFNCLDVQGNGHRIHNFMTYANTVFEIYTDGIFAVNGLTFSNIKCDYVRRFMYVRSAAYNKSFYDCKFVGKINRDVSAYGGKTYFASSSGGLPSYQRCSFKLLTDLSSFSDRQCLITNCYMDITDDVMEYFVDSTGSNGFLLFGNSYVKLNAPNFKGFMANNSNGDRVGNSVIDITTESECTFKTVGSDEEMNIVNTTNAPNATLIGNYAGVSEENWLNAEVIADTGFNIIVG